MDSYAVKRGGQRVKLAERQRITTKKMVMIGMMGAVSAVLMSFEFPIPLVPPFVKMDFSELPIILGGFLMGPLAGTMIVGIKILLFMLLHGTTSMGVGEVANVMGSLFYMLPAVFLYRRFRSRRGALAGMLLGTAVTSVFTIAGDVVFIFPAYAKLYGMSMEQIIAVGTSVNPYIKDMFSLMLFSMLPFNLFKFAVVSGITFAVYKKISGALKKFLH